MGLAAGIEPALREATDGRLGGVEWFRAAWQRGGASTGFAVWTADSGAEIPVLVKVPVGPAEHQWTTALGSVGGFDAGARSPTPRVLASGSRVGDYDLAWLVMERLPGQTLGHELTKASVTALFEAAAAFHQAAAAVEGVHGHPPEKDWAQLFERSRAVLATGRVPDSSAWHSALKRAEKALPRLRATWAARPIDTWCHGDLHPGNAMRRVGASGEPGACVLIDLALVHPGHWIEDALYLERQHWGRAEKLHKVKPVSALARARRALGLPCADGYAELAHVRRVLMAASVPALIEHEGGDEVYLAAARETLDRLLSTLGWA